MHVLVWIQSYRRICFSFPLYRIKYTINILEVYEGLKHFFCIGRKFVTTTDGKGRRGVMRREEQRRRKLLCLRRSDYCQVRREGSRWEY